MTLPLPCPAAEVPADIIPIPHLFFDIDLKSICLDLPQNMESYIILFSLWFSVHARGSIIRDGL